jgi:hypothetical protein
LIVGCGSNFRISARPEQKRVDEELRISVQYWIEQSLGSQLGGRNANVAAEQNRADKRRHKTPAI